MSRTLLRVARPVAFVAAMLSLSACVVAQPRPYYVGYWHHPYYHPYYY
ncbi:hypothetical protein NFI95_14090 [Acetobacteraceae bacterium KSS8]|uniref:Lipoprotein n=1 Tax=Endosaccharibacter trunci TaxID=2812733 RepID=A0ABT1WBE1_9PROT|nr:hypothetical protein [Acetobacteraceae bacterium KSS8]